MLVFVVAVEAVTGGYKTRYIRRHITCCSSILPCRPCLVRFARHNIWSCQRERWQARLNGSLPRCSPCTIAYCTSARKFGFGVGIRSISADVGVGDLAKLILCECDKVSSRVREIAKTFSNFLQCFSSIKRINFSLIC